MDVSGDGVVGNVESSDGRGFRSRWGEVSENSGVLSVSEVGVTSRAQSGGSNDADGLGDVSAKKSTSIAEERRNREGFSSSGGGSGDDGTESEFDISTDADDGGSLVEFSGTIEIRRGDLSGSEVQEGAVGDESFARSFSDSSAGDDGIEEDRDASRGF